MPNYVRVMRRGRWNSRVVLEDGTTTLVSNNDLPNWTCVGGNVPVQPIAQHTPSQPRQSQGFVNPENQADRVYSHIDRRGSRNTAVITLDGRRISVPNDILNSTWLREGSHAYILWQEEAQYPNGRTIIDITFGVELEFVANPDRFYDFIQAMNEAVGQDRFQAPMCYHFRDTSKWLLKTDSSVHNTREGANLRGYELVSPILKLDQQSKEELAKVLTIITSVFEGTVNRTCGTHVHIGNYSSRGARDFHSKVRSFQRNYGYYEPSVFDRITSPSRRQNNSRYCLSCNTDHINDRDRYYKMNVQNVDGSGTLENRQHQGTLELHKIWAWVELNGRYMVQFFKDPSHFDYHYNEEHTLESFFNLIDLSLESRNFFYARESELN